MKSLIILSVVLGCLNLKAEMDCLFSKVVDGVEVYSFSLNEKGKLNRSKAQTQWTWENQSEKVEVYLDKQSGVLVGFIRDNNSGFSASGGKLLTLRGPLKKLRLMCMNDPFAVNQRRL